MTARTVEATGTAKTPFDHVGFTVTVVKRNKDSRRAKEDAKPIVEAVTTLIARLVTEGLELVEDSQRVTFSIDPNMPFDSRTQVQVGYIATAQITFRTRDTDRASEIMDALTDIPDVQVAAPSFKVDDTSALYREALEDAKKQADEKFRVECEVLGLNPADYELLSWQVREAGGDRHGKAMMVEAVMSTDPAEGLVQLEAGQASVSVTLYVSYRSLDAGAGPVMTVLVAGIAPETEPSTHVQRGTGDPRQQADATPDSNGA